MSNAIFRRQILSTALHAPDSRVSPRAPTFTCNPLQGPASSVSFTLPQEELHRVHRFVVSRHLATSQTVSTRSRRRGNRLRVCRRARRVHRLVVDVVGFSAVAAARTRRVQPRIRVPEKRCGATAVAAAVGYGGRDRTDGSRLHRRREPEVGHRPARLRRQRHRRRHHPAGGRPRDRLPVGALGDARRRQHRPRARPRRPARLGCGETAGRRTHPVAAVQPVDPDVGPREAPRLAHHRRHRQVRRDRRRLEGAGLSAVAGGQGATEAESARHRIRRRACTIRRRPVDRAAGFRELRALHLRA